MTMVAASLEGFRALERGADLPSTERGAGGFWALARFAVICAGVAMTAIEHAGGGRFGGGGGKWLRGNGKRKKCLRYRVAIQFLRMPVSGAGLVEGLVFREAWDHGDE